jgi:methionyl-tRNA formyltransferase
MRIVFFGSPAAALPSLQKLLEVGHSVELVITQPDKPAGRGKSAAAPPVKKFALERGIRVLQPWKIRQDPSVVETLRTVNPDINVVVAYGQIIPDSIIYVPRFRSVNVHFSLLPKYRGAAPVEWAILRGEEKTGVTIFELNERMDEGDILTSEEVEIGPGENAGQLEARLSIIGARLLVNTLANIETLPRRPQDHSQSPGAPRLKKDQGRIDWGQKAEVIERMVRAFSPWPGAFTFWNGQRLIIHAGRTVTGESVSGPPGRVSEIQKEGFVVGCADRSAYRVERVQMENKKALPAPEFLRGTKLKPGDILG